MTSPADDTVPVKLPPPSLSNVIPIHVTNSKSPEEAQSPQASAAGLPLRSSSPPAATPSTRLGFADRVSRSVSPHGRLSRSLSRVGRSTVPSPLGSPTNTHDDIRSLIVRHFSPVVAIFASPDTEELVWGKGFKKGFHDLVRPFGEKVQGKVVVRDSIGSSRAWDDFAVRFTDLGDCTGTEGSRVNAKYAATFPKLEEVLDRYVESQNEPPSHDLADQEVISAREPDTSISSYYRFFLSRLLSAGSFSPHETFLHPVACAIVISSRNEAPIEALRQLYAQTAQGSKVLPSFANSEYLRYYVLIHDEDRDDMAKSSALFDQMKRHFGLHCHLLRLRSRECLATDPDGVETPACEWISPEEDLARFNDAEDVTDTEARPSLFESDVVAISSFIRELVAQSVIPHMEHRIAQWNDQVASRRRGISGRFMSISKKWTGFSASTIRSMSSQGGASSASSGNYDSLQGIYNWETPEAILRKLGDYAFLIRDYKLAASTYEMLRTEYGNDKAWRYHAGANEMCAISHLLNPMATAKTRVDGFDQMLETASYSYLTRCSDPQNALRSMTLGVELLKVRGRSAAEIAAKWAIRILELGLVGPVGHVLVSERVASCYAAQAGTHHQRRRKAGFWNIMAAEEWLKLGKAELAAQRLDHAVAFYGTMGAANGPQGFKEMTSFLEQLHLAVRMKTAISRSRGVSNASNGGFDPDEVDDIIPPVTEEISEQLDTRSGHRRSMLGPGNPLDGGPLSPIRLSRPAGLRREDDNFE